MSVSSSTSGPAPLGSWAFLRAYGVTMRPYLCFVSGISGVLGLAVAGGPGWPAFALAGAVFFLSYGFGQALTDVFQTDTDALSSPYRPLPRGVISRGHVLLTSLAGLAVSGLVLAVMNPWSLALSVAAVLGLALYTPFKRRWWAGPLWNAWVVAVLPAIGFLCGGGRVTADGTGLALGAAMASVFMSYAVFVLLGYFKDISADSATGYRTLPVVAGWRRSVWTSLVLAVAALVSSVVLLAALGVGERPGDESLVAAVALWLSGLVLLIGAHPLMLRLGAEGEAHRAIAWCVRGYVLLHLGESALAMPALLVPGLVFYAGFEVALAVRPERSQI